MTIVIDGSSIAHAFWMAFCWYVGMSLVCLAIKDVPGWVYGLLLAAVAGWFFPSQTFAVVGCVVMLAVTFAAGLGIERLLTRVRAK